ncbi:MAG: hypothetical protein F6K10_04655 [Moorea sp. SIO2B7]|nr:hypothetical protein [Moorena sp. SIO2B7]
MIEPRAIKWSMPTKSGVGRIVGWALLSLVMIEPQAIKWAMPTNTFKSLGG